MVPLETGVPTLKVRVLIGDDEEVIIQTLAAVLQLGGYDAAAVYDGEAGLRLLNLFHPELVITDVSSAHSDGDTPAVSRPGVQGRCRVLLFMEQAGMHSLLQEGNRSEPSFELVLRPMRPEDLTPKLHCKLCSEQPPVVIPIELSDAKVH